MNVDGSYPAVIITVATSFAHGTCFLMTFAFTAQSSCCLRVSFRGWGVGLPGPWGRMGCDGYDGPGLENGELPPWFCAQEPQREMQAGQGFLFPSFQVAIFQPM